MFMPLSAIGSKLIMDTCSEATLRADAKRLSALFNHDVERLKFEWDRRSFGSYATTVDGSPVQRDRFFRAWQYAREYQQEQQKVAAE
jgi:hypothetical protein